MAIYKSEIPKKTSKAAHVSTGVGDKLGMRLEIKPLAVLDPAPYNPRVALAPGDPAYEKLRRSLDEFGLVEPLVWNERTGHLVGGHQRLRVLLDRSDTEAPVVVVDLPIAKEQALNLALNKISGDWDEQKLATLLGELLEEPDFDRSPRRWASAAASPTGRSP